MVDGWFNGDDRLASPPRSGSPLPRNDGHTSPTSPVYSL